MMTDMSNEKESLVKRILKRWLQQPSPARIVLGIKQPVYTNMHFYDGNVFLPIKVIRGDPQHFRNDMMVFGTVSS